MPPHREEGPSGGCPPKALSPAGMPFPVSSAENLNPSSGADLHGGLGDIVAQAFAMGAARVLPSYFLEGGETVTALSHIVHRGDTVHCFRAQRFPTARLCADGYGGNALPHRFRGFHRIREPRDLQEPPRPAFVAGR